MDMYDTCSWVFCFLNDINPIDELNDMILSVGRLIDDSDYALILSKWK